MTFLRARLLLFTLFFAGYSAAGARKPNIILIMTDDMGYSDLGCFGSEIKTPNLDALAEKGVRLSSFYNFGKCCPTRAGLMTGLYNHQAGVGDMTGDEGFPGYRGRLNDQCRTIGEVLKKAGYQTIQTGKWHLGAKQKSWWPQHRGFDQTFGCPLGGGFYFRPSAFHSYREIMRNDTVLYTPKIDPPEGFYTTDAYTDEGLVFAREALEKKEPFFWYLAYNAPHWPLRAKPADIAKYRDTYRKGWDQIRRDRHAKLIKLGLIDEAWELSPRGKKVPAWDKLTPEERDRQAKFMAVYAAMIDCVDQNVGKIVAELKSSGAYENTLIIFICDNGGGDEKGLMGINTARGKGRDEFGSADSFIYPGRAWANVSNVPFRRYKSNLHEGAIATPFIAHWPSGIPKPQQGSISRETAHIIDIMPTCLEISQAKYPTTIDGRQIYPLSGTSLLPILKGIPFGRSAPLFSEYKGNRMVREGKWKLVSDKNRPWELYNMEKDRTELHNLADKNPHQVGALAKKYQTWAKNHSVIKKRTK